MIEQGFNPCGHVIEQGFNPCGHVIEQGFNPMWTWIWTGVQYTYMLLNMLRLLALQVELFHGSVIDSSSDTLSLTCNTEKTNTHNIDLKTCPLHRLTL